MTQNGINAAKKILVVDDEKTIRELFRRILKGANYQVDYAENGRQAIEKMHAEVYDIVFLDIMMPEISGIEVLKSMKDAGRRLPPVIMMTGYAVSENREEAKALGAAGWLPKPFEIADVLKAIE